MSFQESPFSFQLPLLRFLLQLVVPCRKVWVCVWKQFQCFKLKLAAWWWTEDCQGGEGSSWKSHRTMARAILAEAVLSNVLHYIHNTKHIRHGNAISCRNFLMSVCFHKHSFPEEAHSARTISEQTSINRKTLAIHVKSQQLLRNIKYKPFAKGSVSHYWGNVRYVHTCFLCYVRTMCFPKTMTSLRKKITINANVDC